MDPVAACRRARASRPASAGSAATDPGPAAARTRARRASRRRRGSRRARSRSRGRRCPCRAGPGPRCCRCARRRGRAVRSRTSSATRAATSTVRGSHSWTSAESRSYGPIGLLEPAPPTECRRARRAPSCHRLAVIAASSRSSTMPGRWNGSATSSGSSRRACTRCASRSRSGSSSRSWSRSSSLAERRGWFAAARRHPGASGRRAAARARRRRCRSAGTSARRCSSGRRSSSRLLAATLPTRAPRASPVGHRQRIRPDAAPAERRRYAQSIRSGTFAGADDFHFGSGNGASCIETAPGTWIVRFEDFSVRNGPDLFVYLSPDPDGYADGAVELGTLKATDGSFNY